MKDLSKSQKMARGKLRRMGRARGRKMGRERPSAIPSAKKQIPIPMKAMRRQVTREGLDLILLFVLFYRCREGVERWRGWWVGYGGRGEVWLWVGRGCFMGVKDMDDEVMVCFQWG